MSGLVNVGACMQSEPGQRNLLMPLKGWATVRSHACRTSTADRMHPADLRGA